MKILTMIKERFSSFRSLLFIGASFSLINAIIGLGIGLSTIKPNKLEKINGKSSFVLAIAPPRNTNFIKYVASQEFVSKFTAPLISPAPSAKLYEILQLPKMSYDGIEFHDDPTARGSIFSIFTTDNNAGFVTTGRSYPTVWKSIFPGSIEIRVSVGSTGRNVSGFSYLDNLSGVVLKTRSDNHWWTWQRTKPNGEIVTEEEVVKPSDFAQTWKYILDLTTTSELLQPSLEIGLNNSDICNVQQEDYIQKNNSPLDNPFGLFEFEKKEHIAEAREISEEEETKIRKQIEDHDKLLEEVAPACKDFFLELNDDFASNYNLDNPNSVEELKERINKAGIIYNNERNTLLFRFTVKKSDAYSLWLDANLHYGPQYLPSNKKFIDSVGGIDKYGLDKKSTIGNGSHLLKSLELGQLGYAELTPNPDFWLAKTVLTGNVKIIFNNNPVTINSLFEDGKIATTRLTNRELNLFYNKPEYRRFLKKQTGYGTFSLTLNLSKERNSPLLDDDLRRALYYVIDREQALKIANWDSSFPVTTFTAFGQTAGRLSYQASIEIFQDAAVYNSEAPATVGGKNIPVRTVPTTIQQSKSKELESFRRVDKSFLPDVAKFYLDRYKKNHPNTKKVSLDFVYDTAAVESKGMYILLDSLTRKYFGDYLEIVEKPVPNNFYESLRTTGKFDLTTYTVEPSGSGNLNYIKNFFWEDGLIKTEEIQKRTGFKQNISGEFTFQKWFAILKEKGLENETRDRLGIDDTLWEFIKFLTYPQKSDDDSYNEVGYEGTSEDDKIRLVHWKRRISRIENLSLTKEELNKFDFDYYNDNSDLISIDKSKIENLEINDQTVINQLSLAFELIIREAVPVIPIMEVDTYWIATRLVGTQNFNHNNPIFFAYLCSDKPLEILPGCSTIAEG